MRRIVIFAMILTIIIVMAGCTLHNEPDTEAAEKTSANTINEITTAEKSSKKTENETVEKSKFIAETKQPPIAKTDTERVSKEPNFSQTTTAKNETKQDTLTQKELPQNEISEPEITTNTASEVTTAVEQIEEFDINYWISYAQNYAQSIGFTLDETAIECWDNPISANANNKNIGFDIESRLNRYRNDEGFISVWIWAEKISDTQYELYIGYA